MSLSKFPQPLTTLLPREVINLWLDGKYSTGPQRSVAYDRLGWSLMLRGLYRYEILAVDDSHFPPTTHRGYCIFDLYDGEMICYGIRVYTGPQWDSYLHHQPHPLFWYSDVCHIKPHKTHEGAKFTCQYRLLLPGRWEGAKDSLNPFRNLWGEAMTAPPQLAASQRGPEAQAAAEYFAQAFSSDLARTRDFVQRVGDARASNRDRDPMEFLAEEIKRVTGNDAEFRNRFNVGGADAKNAITSLLTDKGLQRFATCVREVYEALLGDLKASCTEIKTARGPLGRATFEDLVPLLRRAAEMLPTNGAKSFMSVSKSRLVDATPLIKAIFGDKLENNFLSCSQALEDLDKELKTIAETKKTDVCKRIRGDGDGVSGSPSDDAIMKQFDEAFGHVVSEFWSRIRPVVYGGFLFQLRAFAPDEPVDFSGDYGAFGENSVRGKIRFERLDDIKISGRED
jgi:hypothetical protein